MIKNTDQTHAEKRYRNIEMEADFPSGTMDLPIMEIVYRNKL